MTPIILCPFLCPLLIQKSKFFAFSCLCIVPKPLLLCAVFLVYYHWLISQKPMCLRRGCRTTSQKRSNPMTQSWKSLKISKQRKKRNQTQMLSNWHK
eukprot:g29503.t1